jgi:hypothetical protein
MTVWVRLSGAFAGASLAASLALLGCSGEQCSGMLYEDRVTLSAPMPPIGGAAWTVTVCQNADCGSAEMTSTSTITFGVSTSYTQEQTEWVLSASMKANSPKDGDVWLLRVTDQAKAVVFEDQQAVTYETLDHGCSGTSKRATVQF